MIHTPVRATESTQVCVVCGARRARHWRALTFQPWDKGPYCKGKKETP